MSGARFVSFQVAVEEAGERLDRVCAARLSVDGISRSVIGKLCDQGDVCIGNGAAKASARVREGDHISLTIPPPEALTAAPEVIPLTVLYEDDFVLVVDKPAGLVVHPARGHPSGTLVNAVLHHAHVEDREAPLRPGIVHRLDKGTSGVLVVAKTDRAREGLKAQFQARSIERSYVGLALGSPPDEVTFDTLHGRHPIDRLRFTTTRVREGKRAVTRVQVIERLAHGTAALLRCSLATGRTHQIRVHLSEAGFALVGDPLYGTRPKSSALRAVAETLGRQALHAEVLGFVHPISSAPMRFVAPIPADLACAIEAVRKINGVK